MSSSLSTKDSNWLEGMQLGSICFKPRTQVQCKFVDPKEALIAYVFIYFVHGLMVDQLIFVDRVVICDQIVDVVIVVAIVAVVVVVVVAAAAAARKEVWVGV